MPAATLKVDRSTAKLANTILSLLKTKSIDDQRKILMRVQNQVEKEQKLVIKNEFGVELSIGSLT